MDSEQLKVKCAENIDKPVKLIVYSSKNQDIRGIVSQHEHAGVPMPKQIRSICVYVRSSLVSCTYGVSGTGGSFTRTQCCI